MPKLSLQKDRSDTVQILAGGDYGVHAFLKGINGEKLRFIDYAWFSRT